MTRKRKSERALEQKFRPLVVHVTDDEHFNWLHSRRTPEEKKRDEEISMRFKERIEQLEREEQLRGKNYQSRTEPQVAMRLDSFLEERSFGRVQSSLRLPKSIFVFPIDKCDAATADSARGKVPILRLLDAPPLGLSLPEES